MLVVLELTILVLVLLFQFVLEMQIALEWQLNREKSGSHQSAALGKLVDDSSVMTPSATASFILFCFLIFLNRSRGDGVRYHRPRQHVCDGDVSTVQAFINTGMNRPSLAGDTESDTPLARQLPCDSRSVWHP